MRTSVGQVFICVATLLVLPKALGQRPEFPRIAVQFKGPVGKTLSLGFLESNRRIFAAGDNKVVDFFTLLPGAGVHEVPVRWEFSRGNRGTLNSVVSSSDGTTLLMAGDSVRGLRDIAIADVASRKILGVLPKDPFSTSHRGFSILSVAFSRSQTLAASSDHRGGIWLWDLSEGPESAKETIVRDVGRDEIFFNRVAFVQTQSLLYGERIGQGIEWGIVGYDVATGQTSLRFPERYRNAVTGIAVSRDQNTIVTSEFGPRLWLRKGLREQVQEKELSGVAAIRNVVTSPNGSLIAVMGDLADGRRSFLWLLSGVNLEILDQVTFEGKESCITAAFDSNGAQLLSHDDSRETLLIWQLFNPEGKLLQRPFSNKPLEIRGRGRQFDSARFIRDSSTTKSGYEVLLQDYDRKQLHYSAKDGQIKQLDGKTPPVNSADTFSAGWKINIRAANTAGQKFLLTSPAGSQHEFVIDALHGELTGAHCFIPNADGRPVAIALGTRRLDGVLVFSLSQLAPVNQSPAKLIRYFRDHNGEILSLSVSSDGRYLVSTGKDKTIKLWSLAGILDQHPKCIFGAEFRMRADGALVATNVRPEGILYARGVRNDDRILRYEVMRNGELVTVDTPQGVYEALSEHNPLVELALWTDRLGPLYVRGGGDDRVLIVPGWEPLATLVVDRQDEWVVFTPEGYFDASSAEGPNLFGWQLNLGRDKTPQFEPGSHLQKIYERPGIIERIFRAGNVPDALTDAEKAKVSRDDTLNLRQELRRNLAELPQIEILEPRDGAILKQNTMIDLTVRVTFPASLNPADFSIEATNGGRMIRTYAGETRANVYRWQTTPTDALTILSVTVKEKGQQIVNNLHTERHISLNVEQPVSKKPGQLFFLGAAASDYKHLRKLDHPVEDVRSLESVLKDHAQLTRYMTSENVVLLEEENLTRGELLAGAKQLVDRINARKNPEDLLIVHIAGHGVLLEDAFYFVPPAVDAKRPEELRAKGVPWVLLCDAVSGAFCHVFWVVDACHAGAASKYGVREVLGGNTPGRCVIWAADATEEALEDSLAKVRKGDSGHGYVSMAILETLVGNEVRHDADEVRIAVDKLFSDGLLDIHEISNYVNKRVIKVTDQRQHPVFAPKPEHARTIKLLSREVAP